jgi:hypothetical protein
VLYRKFRRDPDLCVILSRFCEVFQIQACAFSHHHHKKVSFPRVPLPTTHPQQPPPPPAPPRHRLVAPAPHHGVLLPNPDALRTASGPSSPPVPRRARGGRSEEGRDGRPRAQTRPTNWRSEETHESAIARSAAAAGRRAPAPRTTCAGVVCAGGAPGARAVGTRRVGRIARFYYSEMGRQKPARLNGGPAPAPARPPT